MPFTKLEDTSKADFDFLGRNLNEKWSLWHRMSVLQCVSGVPSTASPRFQALEKE